MKLTPFRDKVLILVDRPQEQTESGLVLPTQYGPPPGSGTVVACGPGRWAGGDTCPNCQRKHPLKFVPMTIRPGDRVGYRWIDVGEGRKWQHEGKDYVFLRESELFLVTENTNQPEPKAA